MPKDVFSRPNDVRSIDVCDFIRCMLWGPFFVQALSSLQQLRASSNYFGPCLLSIAFPTPVINALQNAEHLQSTKCILGVLKGSFYRSSLGSLPTTKCSAGMFFLQSSQSIL